MKNIYQKIYPIVLDAKGFDIKIYDIRKQQTGMDYIFLVTANSIRHIQGIYSNIKQKLKKEKIDYFGVEGDKNSDWVLMDYSDTLVHLMTIEVREKYNLEELYLEYFQAREILIGDEKNHQD